MATDRTLTWATELPPSPVPREDEVRARYEDLGLIAEGGMGEVRRVRDHLLDYVVAMKILGADRVGSAQAKARFVAEATVTARLRHPGIVAVHDRGERADGALWYTMNEVQGETFTDRIQRLAPGPERLRTLLTTLRAVCEALAYAHREGIVHRDLKPDNVMIGEFGEVLVVDWGIAGRVGGPAEPAGTPGWLSPEQARGASPAPQADVYALGGILHLLLTGRPVRTGSARVLWEHLLREPPVAFPQDPEDLPPPLVALCRAAMDADPAKRPADAGAFAERLSAWLEAAEREAAADQILAEAMAARPQIAELRDRAETLAADAERALAALSAYAPSEAKEDAWARQDEAAVADRLATVLEERWLQGVGAALIRDPGHAGAHAALADHHAAALERAEADRHPQDALRAEIQLKAHDRGRYAPLLRGHGAVTLVTDPPGAEVALYRYVQRGRRLVAEPHGTLGTTPIVDATLERGSWLLALRAPGRALVRYPLFLGRGESWQGVRPGSGEPFPVALPLEGALGPDECYIPAGWFWCGGDPDAIEAFPRQRVWVDPLVVRRFPVTVGEYRAFLEHVARTDPERAVQLGPIGRLGDGGRPLARVVDGRVDLGFVQPRSDRHPMTQVQGSAAVAFAAWQEEQTGLGWRLPDEVEWEKAARGADGRRFVTGDHGEPGWFNVLGAGASARDLEPVGGMSRDESLYGVRDLAGNALDYCANGWREQAAPTDGLLPSPGRWPEDPPLRVARGGNFSRKVLGAATRWADGPSAAWDTGGCRLVRSLSSPGCNSGTSRTRAS